MNEYRYCCCHCRCWVSSNLSQWSSLECWCCSLTSLHVKVVAWKGNYLSSWIPLVVACFQKELLSIIRSKPSVQKRPGNQVRQIAHLTEVELEELSAARKFVYWTYLCKSLISLLPSLFLSLMSSWKTWFLISLHRSRPWASNFGVHVSYKTEFYK